MRSSTVACLALVALTGCSAAPGTDTSDGDTGDAAALTYYRDVKPILDAYCVHCHRPGAVGPFSLDTFESASAVASILPASVESRQMPPFLAAPAVRPLRHDMSLSDEQIALISTWVDRGAPMGSPDDEGPAIDLPRPSLARRDLELGMEEPYIPTHAPDEYRCFVLDWPESKPRYITALEYAPGNLAIAHHAVIYLVDAEYAAAVDAADGADGERGYSCFGGASPDGASSFPTKLLPGWGPGAGAAVFADGVGIRVLPATRVVLQMHYSILADGPAPDQTRVAFQLEDAVTHEGGALPLLDPQWPADPASMLIPAGAAEVTHTYVGEPTASPLLGEFVPGTDPSEGLIVHSMLTHMHKLGAHMFVEIERAGGAIEPLITIRDWDFDWQYEYVFEDPPLVLPGDKLRLSCTWDNSAENQPVIQGVKRAPQDVVWGEGTYDEMCAASLFVHGVAEGDTSCAELGTVPADAGRFLATFDAAESVRDSPMLEGELRGRVVVSVYRDEDVGITGPKAGAEPLGSVTLDEVDLRSGPSAPVLLDLEVPAGRYQLLGFLDSDGNADPNAPSPDLHDPVLIPGSAHTLACETQPITLTFPLLLPF